MASSYPGALDSFTTKTDQVDIVAAAHINDMQNAIVATQTELGTDPAGSLTDITTRLAVAIAGDGLLAFASATRLAISSAAITVTQNWHTVDGEGDASDVLSTINGGAEGDILVIRADDDAATITIDTAGNILLISGRSIILDDQEDICVLIYDAGLSKWLAWPCEDPVNAVEQTLIRYVEMVAVDFTTNATVADGHGYFHIPTNLAGYALIEVHGEVITAGTTGVQTIQIHNKDDTQDLLSTAMTIDTAETGSDTAATPAVIYSDGKEIVAENDLIRIDIDVLHTTPAKGLIMTLGYQLP